MIFLPAGTLLCNRVFGRLRYGRPPESCCVFQSRRTIDNDRCISTGVALLVEERITAQNIEFTPTLLIEAIVDAAHAGERDELLLVSAALVRIANHERDELESGLRISSDCLH
jgi:hypothetical protein